MKASISFLIIIIALNLINDFNALSDEIVNDQNKNRNIEEDEFDDPSLLKKKSGKSTKKKKKKEKPEPSSETIQDKIDNDNIYPSAEQLRQEKIEEMNKYKFFFLRYSYEICMFTVLIIFILNIIYGIKKNRSIADKWFMKNRSFFEDNYAHLGGEREYNPENLSLIKDSYNDYKFFASGRVYVSWMIVDINLKRRQDLISVLSQIFLFNEKDRIMYETSFVPAEDIPCIFAICKKKDIKNTKKSYREVDEFTEVENPSYLDKNYVLLTEDKDIINKIFSNYQFLTQYRKIEKFIDLIFFTDRRTAKDKHGLVVSFELKGAYSEADFYDMTLFTHMLIDLLGGMNIKGAYKKKQTKEERNMKLK